MTKKVERGNDNKAFTVSNGDLTDLKSAQEHSRYSRNRDQLTHPEGKNCYQYVICSNYFLRFDIQIKTNLSLFAS